MGQQITPEEFEAFQEASEFLNKMFKDITGRPTGVVAALANFSGFMLDGREEYAKEAEAVLEKIVPVINPALADITSNGMFSAGAIMVAFAQIALQTIESLRVEVEGFTTLNGGVQAAAEALENGTAKFTETTTAAAKEETTVA